MGRTSGVYLAPGERLSDKRKGINTPRRLSPLTVCRPLT
ncbi:hypothetical protein [Enterobacter phage 01_vB_Eclo_IJM]|nr:hypothetical protein [Enterobacter phage 01_vB_Eclo_IJM]